MYHRLQRRDFLAQTSRAAVGTSLLSLVTPARAHQASVQPKQGALSETGITALEALISKLMKDADVPGLSIALIQDARLLWRQGFGVKDSASKQPVDNDTIFEAASVSKTVFAYAAMKLCEKGTIGLDTPLTKYAAAAFLEGDPRLELITARHVLSHTGGFQNWRSDDAPLKIHFTPGEKYLYSGEGYSYLQSVITHVTRQQIEPFIKKNLLMPFGMTASGYAWNDMFEKRMARPHDEKGKPFDNNKPDAKSIARYAAAGELRTNPTDYSKFLVEVIAPKKRDAFRLSPNSLAEMLRPQVKVADATSWGLGWQIQHSDKGSLIMHGGDNKGFHAFVAASVERKRGIVIMTNGENGKKVIMPLLSGEIVQQFFGG